MLPGIKNATEGRELRKAAACECSEYCFCLCSSASCPRMTAWTPADALGRRILCGTEYATVRYVGSVPPTAGERHGGKSPLMFAFRSLVLILKKSCKMWQFTNFDFFPPLCKYSD